MIKARLNDYEIIDASDGYKLERWGKYKFLRPDPNCMWSYCDIKNKEYDAIYIRDKNKSGHWVNRKKVPSRFTIDYDDLKFYVYELGFKHTGIFPEQVVNWKYEKEKILNSNRNIRVLNLFAYSGCSTCVMMSAGAIVTHVDSSKSVINMAKDNIRLNNLDEKNVRFICEDVVKFLKREIRREKKYDAIIMDPPSYGIGNNHEVWNIKDNLNELIELCSCLLSDNPLFLIVNTYSGDINKPILYNILETKLSNYFNGDIVVDDIVFCFRDNLFFPCGISARVDNI